VRKKERKNKEENSEKKREKKYRGEYFFITKLWPLEQKNLDFLRADFLTSNSEIFSLRKLKLCVGKTFFDV